MNTPVGQKQLLIRVAVSLWAGAIVAIVSLFVAWSNARVNVEFGEQRLTQWQLEEIKSAIDSYLDKSSSLPASLSQLFETQDALGLRAANGRFPVDGWGRPFIYSANGTNYLVSSYGRDGKPGGVGLDCDLTSRNPNTSESWPTFSQFFVEMQTERVTMTCFLAGALTFALSLYVVTISKRGIGATGLVIVATMVGAVFVAAILAALHYSSGH